MDIRTELSNLKKLNLPTGDFVVVSSGALAIRDIREAKDLDIIVTDQLWNELAQNHSVELNDWGIERINLGPDIEILNPMQSIFGNGKIVSLREIFDKADIFDGIKFINLDHLKRIKAKLGREIDLHDVELIDAYLHEKEVIEHLELEGYNKVYVYDAEPGEIDEQHQHDFDTKLVILNGEIQIKSAEGSFFSNMSYKTGSEVAIPRNKIHEAKIGSEGCRYIVAEKHYKK